MSVVAKRVVMDPSKVYPAPWNPYHRCVIETKQNQKMIGSFQRVGQLVACNVFPHPDHADSRGHFMLEDGHRRWTVRKALNAMKGETPQPLIVDIHNVTLEEAKIRYAELNANNKPHNLNDLLGIWLADRTAVPGALQRRFKKMTDIIGTGLARKLHEKGKSPQMFDLARSIVVASRAMVEDNKETVCVVLEWLLKQKGMIGAVHTALLLSSSHARTIIRAAKTEQRIEFDDSNRLQLVG